ncbi:MAG: DUF547 domain-containing protein [Deltaproteobacteria bacterium]|nr:DUF547 domain-containing protein [Deltaproteobacteria bacterium]MBT6433302.1 DUF547 domain-containing protein [Deltaproteobacteria bacterium]MBT6489555.1 DUF547 domain-containing protein [Deltaproteobacteria bacterium]
MFKHFLLYILVIFITLVNLHAPLAASSKSENCQTQLVSHDDWNVLLNRYVKDGFVDYRSWHAISEDRVILTNYLSGLAGYCKPAFELLPAASRLAFTLNLYNAAVIDLVLKNYPLNSINDIDDKVFNKPIMKLEWLDSKSVSLNALENEIIRPTFKDPRIHFALVCAAVSCPRLLNQAYSPAKVDKQLEAQTNNFFRDRLQVDYSQKGNVLKVSKIFEWYRQDFEIAAGSLNNYLKRELQKVQKSPSRKEAEIQFFEYSWKLNQSRK